MGQIAIVIRCKLFCSVALKGNAAQRLHLLFLNCLIGAFCILLIGACVIPTELFNLQGFFPQRRNSFLFFFRGFIFVAVVGLLREATGLNCGIWDGIIFKEREPCLLIDIPLQESIGNVTV